MKSVCRVSVAFSSLTMRLKLSKLSRISRKTLFVSTCTRKLPPATSFIARDRREMGAKNAMEKPAAVALPSSSVKMSSHTNIGTLTNHSGGIQAGISNGEKIIFSVGFKPAASIGVVVCRNKNGELVEVKNEGRHDVAPVLRCGVVVEAMAALVIADLMRCTDNKTAMK